MFDHTSIIKTILKRFCVDPQDNVPSMGARVDHAHHLGGLLTEANPRAVRPIPIGVASGGDLGHGVASSPTAQAAGGPQQPNDLQKALLLLREQLPYMKQLMAKKQ